MPKRPKKVVSIRLAQGSYHPPRAPRESAAARGYDGQWRKIRIAHLRTNPVCVVPGCGRAAYDVDHIVPIRQGGARLDRNNLQSFCHACHSKKTAKDGRKRGEAGR